LTADRGRIAGFRKSETAQGFIKSLKALAADEALWVVTLREFIEQICSEHWKKMTWSVRWLSCEGKCFVALTYYTLCLLVETLCCYHDDWWVSISE
jgi:hypothetical protein